MKVRWVREATFQLEQKVRASSRRCISTRSKYMRKVEKRREKKGYKERTHEEEHGYCLRFCRNRAHSIRSLIFHSSFLDTHYLLKKEKEKGNRKQKMVEERK